MLDQYFWGNVSRISPEAPVPVVEIESESYRFGGAANVSHNVATLGACVIPVGVIGDDNSGMVLKRLHEEKGFPVQGLIVDSDRPTTVKTRIIAHGQHVVRTDREMKKGISRKIQSQILDFFESKLDAIDGLILEDYNKGLLVPHVIESVIGWSNRKGVPIFVDPKFDHFMHFKHVTLFKPNRKETADILGVPLDSAEALERAGERLLEKLEVGGVLITLGAEGMMLMEAGKPVYRIPTQAQKVHDVSGAGDTVIATMAVSFTGGADLREAAYIANHAAGIVCGEVGVVPVDADHLLRMLIEESGTG
jgi:D-beta-D-heptose 7-phosphate kinase/D-beta-D-heptose 1-phosphate adenosyltransferase